MYVCGCRAVTDRQVRKAVGAGARTAAEVALLTGAASRCGTCIDLVHAVMEAAGAPVESPVTLRPLATSA